MTEIYKLIVIFTIIDDESDISILRINTKGSETHTHLVGLIRKQLQENNMHIESKLYSSFILIKSCL